MSDIYNLLPCFVVDEKGVRMSNDYGTMTCGIEPIIVDGQMTVREAYKAWEDIASLIGSVLHDIDRQCRENCVEPNDCEHCRFINYNPEQEVSETLSLVQRRANRAVAQALDVVRRRVKAVEEQLVFAQQCEHWDVVGECEATIRALRWVIDVIEKYDQTGAD